MKPETDESEQASVQGYTVNSDASAFAAGVFRTTIYDAGTGRKLAELPPELSGEGAGFVPGGPYYLAAPDEVVARSAGFVPADFILYDWKRRTAVAALVGHPADKHMPPTGVSGDGRTVVSVAKEGAGLVFDLASVE